MKDNLFITGADANVEWMLPWFMENFQKHNPNAEIMIWDFGMEGSMFSDIRKSHRTQDRGWFKKPSAMKKTCSFAHKVCWLDVDCEVRANIEEIFDYTEPGKLTMAQDRPWMKRRGGPWYNTGVVVFEGIPPILGQWATDVAMRPHPEGDQTNMHLLLRADPMNTLINVAQLPPEYNTIRLDLIDGTAPEDIKIMHWTGNKGKLHIRNMIDG